MAAEAGAAFSPFFFLLSLPSFLHKERSQTHFSLSSFTSPQERIFKREEGGRASIPFFFLPPPSLPPSKPEPAPFPSFPPPFPSGAENGSRSGGGHFFSFFLIYKGRAVFFFSPPALARTLKRCATGSISLSLSPAFPSLVSSFSPSYEGESVRAAGSFFLFPPLPFIRSGERLVPFFSFSFLFVEEARKSSERFLNSDSRRKFFSSFFFFAGNSAAEGVPFPFFSPPFLFPDGVAPSPFFS